MGPLYRQGALGLVGSRRILLSYSSSCLFMMQLHAFSYLKLQTLALSCGYATIMDSGCMEGTAWLGGED
jgi:hypothetical protein